MPRASLPNEARWEGDRIDQVIITKAGSDALKQSARKVAPGRRVGRHRPVDSNVAERLASDDGQLDHGGRAMDAVLLSGSGNQTLVAAIASLLEVEVGEATIERFPDGECHVAVRRPVRGDDVYIVQPTGPPVDEHLVEALLLVDACRRGGAARITLVIPYFGYARQDRRRAPGEPLATRVVADLIGAVRADRVLTVDPHTTGLEAFFGFALEAVSAVPLLASRLAPFLPPDAVIVAPDLGAVRLAERYAALLERPTAVVRKHRLSGSSVRVEEVVGEVAGRTPVIVDDMITTGATICAAAQEVRNHGALPSLLVAATHAVLVGPAVQRLGELAVERLLVTDSLPPHADIALPIDVVSIDRLLADSIARLHDDEPLDDLEPFA
jgi:ribose-phosphate pyrophosphokinase